MLKKKDIDLLRKNLQGYQSKLINVLFNIIL